MKEFAGSDEFSYMKLRAQPPSVWQRIWWWVGSIIEKMFSNPNTPWLSRILFYTLLLIVLAGAIFYILKLRYGGALAPESKWANASGIVGYGTIEGVDYEQLIKDALKESNYKLAIRYSYLKTLHLLAENEFIAFKDWKTPYDYEKELTVNLISPYQKLSRLFEYVWYGDHEATKTDYDQGMSLVAEIQQETK